MKMEDIAAMKMDPLAVSPEVFLYALAIAVGLALVATIVPVWYVGRVRPAEVLRHE